MENQLKEKIEKIEVKLIEQEHRPFVILNNFFIKRKKWTKDDPRQIAATKAIIWRLFFSPTVVALTGGFIALLSLGVFVWQNTLISKQNNFFQAQIKQQDEQYKLQRRTELIRILYEKSDIRLKKEALIEFIELERLERKQRKVDDLSQINLSNVGLNGIRLENVDLSNLNFEGASFQQATLIDVNFENCNFIDAQLLGIDLLEVGLKGVLVSDQTLIYNEDLVKKLNGKYNLIDTGKKTKAGKTISKLELKEDI